MNEILQPWQLLLAILSGWIHHRQQKMIEFQNDQIESLLKQMGRKRILLTDDQRRLLAVKGKALGRKTLQELTTIVTPDTILRWHRKLVANKWDHSEKRKSVGRPRIRQVIVDLILRFTAENPTWGYDRIQGALANVGYHISDSTVGNSVVQVWSSERGVRNDSVPSNSAFRSPHFQKCPRQESNLVLDLRRVACDPAHSKDVCILRSSPPRNRTPSCRIEICRAIRHTRRPCCQ